MKEQFQKMAEAHEADWRVQFEARMRLAEHVGFLTGTIHHAIALLQARGQYDLADALRADLLEAEQRYKP